VRRAQSDLPPSGQVVSFRLEAADVAALQALADADDRTLGQYVRRIVRQYLREYPAR
jgi:hypothetical protein